MTFARCRGRQRLRRRRARPLQTGCEVHLLSFSSLLTVAYVGGGSIKGATCMCTFAFVYMSSCMELLAMCRSGMCAVRG
eukprot:5661203-Alexandrium_andersonii.AAC.1